VKPSIICIGIAGTALALAALMSAVANTKPGPTKDAKLSDQVFSTYQTNYGGLQTNGPAVYKLYITATSAARRNPTYVTPDNPIFSNLSNQVTPEVLARYKKARLSQPEYLTNVAYFTNRVFERYLPESLNYQLWTNFVAWTNGRTMEMWAERRHPFLWPARDPVVRWQTNSLVYGMKGFTGLSPCWDLEGAQGQVPITLVTRRHGYTRGHGMGPEGIKQSFKGRKVWFAAADNTVVEAKVTSAVTRTSGRDYTLLMFSKDLPESIQPLRVITMDTLQQYFAFVPGGPWVTLLTEQTGKASASLPGFTCDTLKGGDSGSPSLLPYFQELVFFGGRTTSGPSKTMQEDINELCRKEKVDPTDYQLQWLDLSSFPRWPRK
jgi:hypothetical protein